MVYAGSPSCKGPRWPGLVQAGCLGWRAITTGVRAITTGVRAITTGVRAITSRTGEPGRF
jgi:hypothetical protein